MDSILGQFKGKLTYAIVFIAGVGLVFLFVAFRFMGGVTAKPGGGLCAVRWAAASAHNLACAVREGIAILYSPFSDFVV